MSSENLWKKCRGCEKQMPANANSCPHCGKKHSRFRALKWISGGFVALIIVSAILAPEKSLEQSTKAATPEFVAANPTAIALPQKQAAFVATIVDYKQRFNSTSNELQRNVLRDQRRVSILKVLDSRGRIDDWIGTLRKLDTNGDGKAIVIIRVAPEIDIHTAGSSLGDLEYRSMIEKNSPVYAQLMNMKTGDTVKFSGSFIYGEIDGIAESSLTIAGAMQAPEFLFRFTEILKN